MFLKYKKSNSLEKREEEEKKKLQGVFVVLLCEDGCTCVVT